MLHVSCRKFSQLSIREKFWKSVNNIDKVTICNAMSYFLDHPVVDCRGKPVPQTFNMNRSITVSATEVRHFFSLQNFPKLILPTIGVSQLKNFYISIDSVNASLLFYVDC